MSEPISERDQIRNEVKASKDSFRAFQTVCNMLGYERPEELRGKTILDVGAGTSPFAEVANRDYQANVLTLEPKYSSKYRKPDPEADPDTMPEPLVPTDPHKAVAGIAQELPFKANSFDETIASWSFFTVKTGLQDAIKEMIRVTKPGGKIRIGPIYEKADIAALGSDFVERSSKQSIFHSVIITKGTPDTPLTDQEVDEISSNILPFILFDPSAK